MKSPSLLLSLVAAVTMTFGISTSSVQGQAGTAIGWGSNNYGQCDTPNTLSDIRQISGWVNYTYALKNDGTLVGWGNNYQGVLSTPPNLSGVSQIESGYHMYALKGDGTLVGWGANSQGQCNTPADLSAVVQVACGEEHTYARKSDGTLLGWGSNGAGECNTPSNLVGVRQVDCGGYFTYALKNDGTLVGWGRNQFSQTTTPAGLAGIAQIACGFEFSYALSSAGTLSGWGRNDNAGQLNMPSNLGVVKQVSCGGYHVYALKIDGTVVGWGASASGQIKTPQNIAPVASIVCCGFHTYALRGDVSDADGDGVPAYFDNCPTQSNPLQSDCDNDGVGDVCDPCGACETVISSTTPNLGAFSFATPASGTIGNCVRATGPVTVTITVVADLGNNTNEYATLKMGGVSIENYMFLTTGHDCPATPDVATLIVSAATWNSFVAQYGANVPVQIVGAVLVDPAQCASPFSTVSVRYGGPNYDCNGNGIQDSCEIGSGGADCDEDGALDACELAAGLETDIDGNGTIDRCQADCNNNALPDSYEIASGFVPDCNGNSIPDSCDITSGLATDCNTNSIPDSCDVATGGSLDCNANSIPDSCDIASGFAIDCNANAIPDSCDIATGLSNDVEPNGVPDECKADCNGNGLPDAYEIAQGLAPDCNTNSKPDSCDIASGGALDCNTNGIPDSCDIAAGETDKDEDGRPDQCEYDYGDFDLDGTIGGVELAIVLSVWGMPNPPVGDVTQDGIVDGQDLAIILGRWGAVPYGMPPLAWATTITELPSASVVTNETLRAAIIASGLPWRVRDTGTGIEMVLVPGGTFTMGCSASTQYGCNSDENPTHQVTLSAFYIGRYEVTQAQWTTKMGSNPSYFGGYSDSPSRPVEQVSWNMIASTGGFMSITGLRLPTEAEWEYAYRAGTTTAFHSYAAQPTGFNDDTLLVNIAWYASNSGSQTHAVGGKYANGLGLHDMSGNVWEWCNDWYSNTYYASSPATNPTGPTTGSFRLLRGGGWDYNSSNCLASQRGLDTPVTVYNYSGFRVARNP